VKEEVQEMRFIFRNNLIQAGAMLVALGSLLPAQHNAGGAGGAHGGGFHATGAAHGAVTARPSPPNVAGFTLPAPNRGPFNSRSGLNGGFSGNRGRVGTNRNPRQVYWGLSYLPWLDYGSEAYNGGGAYNDTGSYQTDPAEQTAEMTANVLGEQIQQLSSEVEQLRSAPYPQTGYTPAPVNDPPAPPTPPVTVVLRGGEQIQVQSYAIMGSTFWDFSKQPARRIPVASIDVAASTKATEATGGEFPTI
jgi:hypothetical protein